MASGGPGEEPAPTWLLHMDLDQFVAAVEVRRHPELRGRPVVVGGTGDPALARMVVATASYEARAFGVRSGMPLRAAARRCPDAVFLPTDHEAYEAASARVMDTLRSFPVAVEVWGWDEAFIGGDIDDPVSLATEIRAAVHAETGLSCAIGIGRNKLQAKTAARFAKPGGIHTLTDETWPAAMGDRPAGDLWGVGPKTVRKLEELGVHTVADLAAADPSALAPPFVARTARWLAEIAKGGGDTRLTTEPRLAKSRSRETTFQRDLTDRAEIEEHLAGLARGVGREMVDAGRRVSRVAVKVRTSTFFTRTRVTTLPGGPTTDPDEVARAALTVLQRFEVDRPVRLLGVRVELAPER